MLNFNIMFKIFALFVIQYTEITESYLMSSFGAYIPSHNYQLLTVVNYHLLFSGYYEHGFSS